MHLVLEYCCVSFTSKRNYNNHTITSRHKKNINKVNDLTCENCSKSFASKQSRNIHMVKCKSNNVQITHNITNNITHNTNITNNIVIFGNEDFSYISKKDIQEALRTKNVLPRLCRLMRRNPHYPENRNIKVTDFSRGKTRIFGQYGWNQFNQLMHSTI